MRIILRKFEKRMQHSKILFLMVLVILDLCLSCPFLGSLKLCKPVSAKVSSKLKQEQSESNQLPVVCTLRKDGVLLINGKPKLPYGFYISTGHTGDMRVRCVEAIHAIGGNTIHIEGPWHEDTRFLDLALKYNMMVIAGHTETEEKLDRVRKFKDHSAIVAWTIYDDANTKSKISHLDKMNRKIKAIADKRLTFIPLGMQSKEVIVPDSGFFNCSDIVGWENYPIACPGAANPTLSATELQMSAIQAKAGLFHRPVWILPQTFAWPGGRIPTGKEYRNLCYVGLINRARGVMPWSIYYRGDSEEIRARKKKEGKPYWQEWYLPDHQELWQTCKVVGQEIKELTPFLLDGEYHKLSNSKQFSAALWKWKHQQVVIIASIDSEKRQKIKIDYPFDDVPFSRLFNNWNSDKLKSNRGKSGIVGEIEPGEVLIFRSVKK